MSERYTYLSQIKFDEWCVATTPLAGIVATCFAFSELQNMCFIVLRPIYMARLCRMRQAYDRPTT